MTSPHDKDVKARPGDQGWPDDLDDASELAEFHGAASALEEFRDSSAPYEPQRNPGSTADDLIALSGLDAAIDDVVQAAGQADVDQACLDTATPAPARRRSWVLPLIITAAVLGLSAVVVAVLVTRDRSEPEETAPRSQFILVKGTVVPEGIPTADASVASTTDADARPAASDGGATAADGGDLTPAPVKAAPSKASPSKASGGANMARAFSAQRGRIAKCFEAHTTSGQAVPQIDIDFTVDGDGNVNEVVIQPDGVRSSGLGACIEKVARSTRFPAPGEQVELRIPIKARRVE